MSSNKRIEAGEARNEESVMPLYQDETVAEEYIENRFKWAWSSLLHRTQVSILNHAIEEHGIDSALELAPGPARLTTEVMGISSGLMIEASEEMINVAQGRLKSKNLEKIWEIRHGNAFDLADIADSFELVYTFRFIRHFEKEERSRLYEQVSSRLADDGLFIFDVVNKTVRNKIDELNANNNNSDQLSVYDVTYLDDEIKNELENFGFDLLYLKPVVNHYFLQTWISYKFDRRLPLLSNLAIKLVEKIPTKTPLEWVAVCRKKKQFRTS